MNQNANTAPDTAAAARHLSKNRIGIRSCCAIDSVPPRSSTGKPSGFSTCSCSTSLADASPDAMTGFGSCPSLFRWYAATVLNALTILACGRRWRSLSAAPGFWSLLTSTTVRFCAMRLPKSSANLRCPSTGIARIRIVLDTSIASEIETTGHGTENDCLEL
eukprot:117583-Rhodomonas_salina.1